MTDGHQADPNCGGVPPSEVLVTGKVMSGSAKASRKMPRFMEELRVLTGLELVPGTLNVRLTRPLQLRGAIPWKGWGYPASLCPAVFLSKRVYIYRYKGMSPDRIEILSDIPLRKTHCLHDGDRVGVSIPSKHVASADLATWMSWFAHRAFDVLMPSSWKAKAAQFRGPYGGDR